MGFLISNRLAITTHSVIPDETIATRCFVRFVDAKNDTHSLDPTLFFYTNIALNFTIIGFRQNPMGKQVRIPIEIRQIFELKTGDVIAYLNSGLVPRNVTGVEAEMFTYTAGM